MFYKINLSFFIKSSVLLNEVITFYKIIGCTVVLVRWGIGLSYFLGGRILADFLDVVKKKKSQTYIGNLVKKTFPKHTLEI